jgi:hypothetical protein
LESRQDGSRGESGEVDFTSLRERLVGPSPRKVTSGRLSKKQRGWFGVSCCCKCHLLTQNISAQGFMYVNDTLALRILFVLRGTGNPNLRTESFIIS